MIIAGAVEFDPEVFLLILTFMAVFFIGLCLTGGLIAWSIARRRLAFLLGGVAFGATAFWFGRGLGLQGAVIGGWLASAAVGVILRMYATAGCRQPESDAATETTGAPTLRQSEEQTRMAASSLRQVCLATLGVVPPILACAAAFAFFWHAESLVSAVLEGLTAEQRQDVPTVRNAVLADLFEGNLDRVEVEADSGRNRTMGVALQFGETDCVLAHIDDSSRTPRIHVWYPAQSQLRADQPGCHPPLALAGPPTP